MTENEIAREIVDAALKVRRALGPYVRLAGLRLGLLVNFGAALMKDGITRPVNGLEDDAP